MWLGFPLFPERASTVAAQVDAIYFFLLGISIFFTALIFLLLVYFAVRYRSHAQAAAPSGPGHTDNRLEIVWTVIPLILVMVSFAWGAKVYVAMNFPPNDALEIHAVGKQWMWKFQHPQGQREINELHVPSGRPVELIMTSEDVIHSFFVPVFRTKMDVLPGRYTRVWFEATAPGTYHLFCTEYCGTKHSGMVGRVIVMTPAAYQRWLGGEEAGESMAIAGGRLFQRLGCQACHRDTPGALGPALAGLFGQPVGLASGETVTADEQYLRDSIVNPQKDLVAGYRPIMPTFKGLISEEGLLQLIAYIKSLEAGTQQKAEQ